MQIKIIIIYYIIIIKIIIIYLKHLNTVSTDSVNLGVGLSV